jgi:beta-galactosidase
VPIAKDDVRPLPLDLGLPIGAQYYRAPTPFPELWERDLDQLKAHGMNVIKIWAQWRWSQPEENTFYFDDLDRLMDLAGERGLRVVINTIFDVAPAWLYREHPECVMVRQDGRRIEPTALLHRQIGGAPGPCLHHAFAREQRERFLRATVERYREHPALWFWDLWNEPELTCAIVRGGPASDQVCYCGASREAFIEWLRGRHETIENLNKNWARNYKDWKDIELPLGPEVYADWIDWRLFFRDTITDEMRWRARLTRQVDTTHPVMCHTVPPPIFNVASCGSDDFELAVEGDLFGNSSASKPFPTDFCRSAAEGRPLVCSEIHAIPGTTLARPTPLSRDELERYILIPLFRGAKGFLFWQYRPEQLGKEAPAWGMIRPDGTPEPWLEHCRDLSGWLEEHAEFIARARPDPAKVAILVVPENEIFFYCHDQSLDRYWNGILGAYRVLEDACLPVDFIHSRQLLAGKASEYESIVAPVPYAYPEPVGRALAEYVRGGGRILSEGFPCALDPATGMSSLMNPGMGLDEVFGCREAHVIPEERFGSSMAYGVGHLEEGARLRLRTRKKIGKLPSGTEVPGSLAQQGLEPAGGEVLGEFSDGSAAVVRNGYGEGSAYLIGCWVFAGYGEHPSRTLRTLVTGLLGLGRPGVCSEEVRTSRISDGRKSWLLLENPLEKAVHAKVFLDGQPGRARTLPGGEKVSVRGDSIEVNVRAESLQVVEVEEG